MTQNEKTDRCLITSFIKLKGTPFDLNQWKLVFWHLTEPRLQCEATAEGAETYIVISERLDGVANYLELVGISEHLITQMNGVARLAYDGSKVEIAGFEFLYSDGEREDREYRAIPYRLDILVGFPVPKDERVPPPSEHHEWLQRSLAKHDTKITEALSHFANRNWYDLWKAFEVVKNDVGQSAIWKKGWARRQEVIRFAMSAQYFRHTGKPRPPDLLSIIDADRFVRQVVTRWIRERQ